MGALEALRTGWCSILKTTRAPPESTATATNEGLADVQGRGLLTTTENADEAGAETETGTAIVTVTVW